MGYSEDKVAIVTGGASGTGRSVYTYLGRHGAQVILSALSAAWWRCPSSLGLRVTHSERQAERVLRL